MSGIRTTVKAALRQAPAGTGDQKHLPKKVGVKTARYCRFERPKKAFFPKNTPIKQDLSSAWTSFPLQHENGIVRLPIRAFYGVFGDPFSPFPSFPNRILIRYGAFFQYASL